MNVLNAVFRVDASLKIGSGHVMRCLTLARGLRERGVVCIFMCREHEGNLISAIAEAGFSVEILSSVESGEVDSVPSDLAHGHWLNASQESDAQASIEVLRRVRPQWLIVDHYGLDLTWEKLVAAYVGKTMVIDDLADRAHQCDVLLDQNLGRNPSDYMGLVSPMCELIIGPRYALLRPEFACLRSKSLEFRKTYSLSTITIAMGGVDEPDATSKVLASLRSCPMPQDTRITVVMGAIAPALDDVRAAAATMPWPTRVLVGINNVGELFASSDLVIGAVGGSAWERCTLGVPTLMVVLAENQRPGALALANEGAGLLIGDVDQIESNLPILLAELGNREVLRVVSEKAANLTDGCGVARVLERISFEHEVTSYDQGIVRAINVEDLKVFSAWQANSDSRCMYPHKNKCWEKYLSWVAQATVDPSQHLLVYEFLGQVYAIVLFAEELNGHTAAWDCYLAPGLSTEMEQRFGVAVLDYAFHNLKLHKVCVQLPVTHAWSILFCQDLGFLQEGILSQEYLDGAKFHDVLSYSLCATEWHFSRDKK